MNQFKVGDKVMFVDRDAYCHSVNSFARDVVDVNSILTITDVECDGYCWIYEGKTGFGFFRRFKLAVSYEEMFEEVYNNA